jgi:hypothetical protein
LRKDEKKPAFSSRILENAARDQMAGPFGKLGRYALKQHWGMTIPDRGEAKQRKPPGKREGGQSSKKGLLRRLFSFLRRSLGS